MLRALTFGAVLLGIAVAPAAAAETKDPWRSAWQVYEAGDFASAIRAWLPLADHGEAEAQYALGILLLYGRGVERDAAAAAAVLSPAAAAGHAEAAYALGLLYQDGNGVPRDVIEAARLYRLGAEAGHAPAQNNLALLYALGEGMARDALAAYVWFSIAARGGEAAAVHNRDRMAAELSPAQLVESERRVQAWTTARRNPRELGVNPAATYPGVVVVLTRLERTLPPPAAVAPLPPLPPLVLKPLPPVTELAPAPAPVMDAVPVQPVEARPVAPPGPPLQLVPARRY